MPATNVGSARRSAPREPIKALGTLNVGSSRRVPPSEPTKLPLERKTRSRKAISAKRAKRV